MGKIFLYLKIHPKLKNQQKIWPKIYIWGDFGQWGSPNKGENWPQSFKFWKSDVLHCSSVVPAPIPSFPGPEIFLRTCLTIASSMAKTIGSSLGSQNWPQSRKKQSKSTEINQNWLFLEKSSKSRFACRNGLFNFVWGPWLTFYGKKFHFQGSRTISSCIRFHLYMSVLMVYPCDVLF